MKNSKEKKKNIKREMKKFIRGLDKPTDAIIVSDGSIMVQGHTVDILSNISTIVKHLIKNGLDKDLIENAVKLGMMNPEELKEEFERKFEELKKVIEKHMKEEK